MDLIFERMEHAAGLPTPVYQTGGSSGADLHAAVTETLVIPNGSRCLIPTGLKIAIPAGFEAQIRPRSGLALKGGVTVLNSPGTIDADYRGELKVLLINLSGGTFEVKRGDRVAQIVIAPVQQVNFVEVAPGQLDATARGQGGFGSTGA